MAFPSRDRNSSAAYRFARAQDAVTTVKNRLSGVIDKMAATRMSATNFTAISVELAAMKAELQAMLAISGIADYTTKEHGIDLTVEASALIAKANEVQAAIALLLPTNAQGWLTIVKFDTDGSLAWRNFSVAEMEPVRLKLVELLDIIE